MSRATLEQVFVSFARFQHNPDKIKDEEEIESEKAVKPLVEISQELKTKIGPGSILMIDLDADNEIDSIKKTPENSFYTPEKSFQFLNRTPNTR